jgi:hypothetical protein
MQANAIVPQVGQPWYKLFDALNYVDNPYALLGYLFLVVIVALGFLKISPHKKGTALLVLAVMILITTGLLLRGSLGEVQRHALIPLINDDQHNSVQVAPGVEIKLLDATSFKAAVDRRGGSGQAHNQSFEPYVWDGVFQRATIRAEVATRARSMNQQEWDRFRATLSPGIEQKLLTTSFVRLQVTVDGRQTSDRYWFRGEIVPIPLPQGGQLRFKIVNLYNTREDSGEPEAINLQPPP